MIWRGRRVVRKGLRGRGRDGAVGMAMALLGP